MPTITPYKDIEFGIPDPPKHLQAPIYRYVPQAYPKVLYKDEVDPETGAAYTSRTAKSLEEHQQFGKGWVESPAEFKAAQPEPKVKKSKAIEPVEA